MFQTLLGLLEPRTVIFADDFEAFLGVNRPYVAGTMLSEIDHQLLL